MPQRISLAVNGEPREVSATTTRTLLDVLRHDLGLTGTKEACSSGICGACTVLIDGVPALSCLKLAVACEGCSIVTIEGLADGEALHPLQESFVDKGAIQCGMCTPGMILTAKDLLDGNSDPSVQQVREALSGNLCRCTGYSKIVDAVLDAAEKGKTAAAGG